MKRLIVLLTLMVICSTAHADNGSVTLQEGVGDYGATQDGVFLVDGWQTSQTGTEFIFEADTIGTGSAGPVFLKFDSLYNALANAGATDIDSFHIEMYCGNRTDVNYTVWHRFLEEWDTTGEGGVKVDYHGVPNKDDRLGYNDIAWTNQWGNYPISSSYENDTESLLVASDDQWYTWRSNAKGVETVQSWLDNSGANNYGMQLRPSEGSGAHLGFAPFDASEHATAAQHPKMTIWFQIDGEPEPNRRKQVIKLLGRK